MGMEAIRGRDRDGERGREEMREDGEGRGRERVREEKERVASRVVIKDMDGDGKPLQ